MGLLILRHTDNLSRVMQKADICAAEGQEVMTLTLTTLRSLRNDSSFCQFWQRVLTSSDGLGVEKPTLPRRRKTPRRLDDGSDPSFPTTVEEHYRILYFEALDLITNRFDQPGYKTYGKVQALLLKAAASEPYEEELQFVLSFYGSDFESVLLKTHLEIFSLSFKPEGQITIKDILSFFHNCSSGQVDLMSQVSKLVKLLVVMPATNAASERSFSAVRRIKTYLRSTMSQQRLNHLMLLHIHRHLTDELDLIGIANDFIVGNDHRKHFFGTESSQISSNNFFL